jgi:hypothetical protein
MILALLMSCGFETQGQNKTGGRSLNFIDGRDICRHARKHIRTCATICTTIHAIQTAPTAGEVGNKEYFPSVEPV